MATVIKRNPILVLAAVLTVVSLLLITSCASKDTTPTVTSSRSGGSRTPTGTLAVTSTAETPVPSNNEGYLAPELAGTQTWINSMPLKINNLRGRVVLIDFWTYTCVNCIRTFPFLKIWHSKYADDGLMIIGVHTPEFQFEHDLENVRQAVTDYSIGWPVVQDNDYETWRAYDNQYWPAKYLMDKDGIIRYEHTGEGGYDETERWIRYLLQEAGADLSSVEPLFAPNQTLDSSYRNTIGGEITAELYGGYERGCGPLSFYTNSRVANPGYCKSKNMVAFFEDSGERKTHRLYLQGSWLAKADSLRHSTDTANFEDYLLLRFAAKSVNVVLTPEKAEPFKVLVTLDGKYLQEFNRGEDVIIEKDGKSFIMVNKPRMYAIVEAPVYGTYNLKLSTNSKNFGLYAFTFGVYEKGI